MLPRLDTIRAGVHRLIDLIDTCLADEQLDAGRIQLHEVALDLAPVLELVAAQHRSSTARDIRLNVAALPAVWGDSDLLRLVFNNLIGNALKYSPTGGAIDVAAAADHGTIRVSVSDDGIGIPQADMPRIFDRFYRAGNVDGVPGSGIGLHMVRQIVELHGGTIQVASRVGEGTCFTVRLRPAPQMPAPNLGDPT